MSTINTLITSSNSPNLYETPSKACIAVGWGKSSEKPAKKHDLVGLANLTKDNQLAAESLLDLVNSDIYNPLANATLETVVTSVHAINFVKKSI